MADLYRCIICQNVAGTKANNGTEDWWWRLVPTKHGVQRRAGPFCSQCCSVTWQEWKRPAQLAAIFGSYLNGIGAEKIRPDLPKRVTYKPILDTGPTITEPIPGNAKKRLRWERITWRAQ